MPTTNYPAILKILQVGNTVLYYLALQMYNKHLLKKVDVHKLVDPSIQT